MRPLPTSAARKTGNTKKDKSIMETDFGHENEIQCYPFTSDARTNIHNAKGHICCDLISGITKGNFLFAVSYKSMEISVATPAYVFMSCFLLSARYLT